MRLNGDLNGDFMGFQGVDWLTMKEVGGGISPWPRKFFE